MTGTSELSRKDRCHRSLLQADSSTPTREPRRAAMALSSIYRGVISPASAKAAATTQCDNLGMCAEILATYVTLRDGLEETELTKGIADAVNPNVSENVCLRDIVCNKRSHEVRKKAGKDEFFNKLEVLVEPVKATVGASCLLGKVWKGKDLDDIRVLLVKLLLVLSVRSEK